MAVPSKSVQSVWIQWWWWSTVENPVGGRPMLLASGRRRLSFDEQITFFGCLYERLRPLMDTTSRAPALLELHASGFWKEGSKQKGPEIQGAQIGQPWARGHPKAERVWAPSGPNITVA